jgi:hypothetical protein
MYICTTYIVSCQFLFLIQVGIISEPITKRVYAQRVTLRRVLEGGKA